MYAHLTDRKGFIKVIELAEGKMFPTIYFPDLHRNYSVSPARSFAEDMARCSGFSSPLAIEKLEFYMERVDPPFVYYKERP